MRIETARLLIDPVQSDSDPDEFLAIFNSNPGYLEASEGKRRYERADAEMYLYAETSRENGRCVEIRLRPDRTLIGTAALLVPNSDGFPWIGLLIVSAERQGEGLGREASHALEAALAIEGWVSVRLGVLKSNERALPFWENSGYQIIDERDNSAGSPCWVLAKALGTTS
jgi:RimJ/RimL family protein N-acetyltransferase